VDGSGRLLAQGKDLALLQRQLRERLQAQLAAAATDIERAGLRAWTLGTLPRVFRRGGVEGYPALVDEGNSVAVRVLGSQAEQQRAMWEGTRRLLLLNVPSPVRAVLARLTNESKLALSRQPHRTAGELFDDCSACAVDRIVADCGGPAWDEAGFARLLAAVRRDLPETAYGVVTAVAVILAAAHEVQRHLADTRSAVLADAVADIEQQLSGLVFPGFVTATGSDRLADVLRYVRGMQRRLAKLPENVSRDRELMESVRRVQQRYYTALGRLSPGSPVPAAWRDIRWMIEELRVSYFAQTLRTAHPVSEKRILHAIDELAAARAPG